MVQPKNLIEEHRIRSIHNISQLSKQLWYGTACIVTSCPPGSNLLVFGLELRRIIIDIKDGDIYCECVGQSL
jgi:hypothetical protein